MKPNLAIVRDGKKFMWDGTLYATGEEASRAKEVYQRDNFEVLMAEEEGQFLVYTRRVVKAGAVTVH